jgi:hypothetical protein
MEWGDEEAEQESTCRGAWQIGWPGPERGQKVSQSRKRPQRWRGQKSQRKTRRTPQRQTPTTGTSKEGLVAAVAAIRSRFGDGTIGLGCNGIRYSAVALR